MWNSRTAATNTPPPQIYWFVQTAGCSSTQQRVVLKSANTINVKYSPNKITPRPKRSICAGYKQAPFSILLLFKGVLVEKGLQFGLESPYRHSESYHVGREFYNPQAAIPKVLLLRFLQKGIM